MAERKTRYNELLGIPNHIREPDLYQLLGVERSSQVATEAVETSYRERMGTLQAIRSPKHKSFIEFLKGELRRARATLTDARKREDYDEELLAERREQLNMILDVVLADGRLTPTEEEKILAKGRDVGLLPNEIKQVLEEELKLRGAQRGDESGVFPALNAPLPPSNPAPPSPAPPSALPPQSSPLPPQAPVTPPPPPPGYGRAGSDRLPPQAPAGGGFFPAGPGAFAPQPRAGSDRLRPQSPSRRYQQPVQEDEVTAELVEDEVTAELVPPPPPSQPPPSQPPARKRASGGWGQAAVVQPVGNCCSCLVEISREEVQGGRVERLLDGRFLCLHCAQRLRSGSICAVCFQRITPGHRQQGQVVQSQGRVLHRHCTG